MNSPKQLAALTITLFTMACTQDKGLCDAEAISSALYGAIRGDTVKIGVCQVTGNFTVPEGVTLEGSGIEMSYLISEGQAPVVTLEPTSGAPISSVRGLTIDSTGSAGLLAEGRGQVAIASVRVRSAYGIGIGIEGVDQAHLTDSQVLGPVTDRNLEDIPPVVSPSVIATHGLVLVRVNDADLAGLDVSGFASMGVVFVQGTTSWFQGSSSANRGTGLIVHGGAADLRDLVLCGGVVGLSMMPVYGAVFAEGAQVTTESMTVCQNQGFGLLHDSSDAVHAGLDVTGNRDVAIWGQNEGTTIDLSDFNLIDNGLGGLVLHHTGRVQANGGAIEETRLGSKMLGEEGSIEVGDGVQVVRPANQVRLNDLALSNNGRVGLLLQLEGATPADLTLEGITVTGAEAQFGALAQGDQAAIPAAWDDEVQRSEELATRDRAQEETGDELDVVENLATGDFPLATDLEREGLQWLLNQFE
jgi:hypothetical protein